MKVGFLWPADGLNDAEYLAYLPEGLSWHVQRYDAGTESEALTPEVLAAYADPNVLARAATGLRALGPDIVAAGDHAACIMGGSQGEAAMAAAVRAVLGVRCITMGQAILAALAALSARQIAVFSPYAGPITSTFRAGLAQSGLTVLASAEAGALSEEDIGPKAAADWRARLEALVREAPSPPEALLIAGGGMCFAAAIEGFEAETGVPVVTGPGALVWAVAKALGCDPARPGLGRLFRPPSVQAAPRLVARQSTGTKSFAVTPAPPVFVAGAGVHLIDETGRAYLDFACGSGTTALGHGHPALSAALRCQAESGITHLGPHFHAPAQAALYDRLAALLPPHLTRFHPAVGGSEATEVALKAAMHATGRRRFLGFTGGYHGRTFGALSVSGARGKNAALAPFAPDTDILPFPDTAEAGRLVAQTIGPAHAGIILEPIQATAGLRRADPEALGCIAAAARRQGVPLIVDEVFTGFGRTGRLFGFSHYDLDPDLVILGKSLGGGFPAGLVAGREALLGRWPTGVQTSTFQLHPIAATTAAAFLDRLVAEDLVARAQEIGAWSAAAFAPLLEHRSVTALRGEGAFWVLQIASPKETFRVRRRALQAGLLTWECGEDGDGIGLVPPLIVAPHHIRQAAMILDEALAPGQ